jgi:hypothetical protein
MVKLGAMLSLLRIFSVLHCRILESGGVTRSTSAGIAPTTSHLGWKLVEEMGLCGIQPGPGNQGAGSQIGCGIMKVVKTMVNQFLSGERMGIHGRGRLNY